MDQTKIKKRRPVSLDRKKAMSGYMFVLPFLVGFVLIYLPILIDSIGLSVFVLDASATTAAGTVYKFVGLEYYVNAFTANTNFVEELLNGIQQLLFEVPAIVIFSLFIAVVLNQKMLGRAAFRAIFFVPVIISTGLMESIGSVDAIVGGSIDDGSGSSGLLDITQLEGLFQDMAIGGELVGVVVDLVNGIYDIVNYSGIQMLIFLAGLQSISESIYEACRIDGATAWETFWKVTFPMISPMILVNTVYTVIDSLTRQDNPIIKFINAQTVDVEKMSMYWIYLLIVVVIIAAVSGIVSSYIFYQRKD